MTGQIAAGGVPTETSPLLSSSHRDSTSSSESSLTSSSDSDSSDDDFIPWYFRPSAELTDARPDTEPEAVVPEQDGRKQAQAEASSTILRIICILLIGTFTANADGSLVLATHPTIASEFNALSASSWLFVSFSLAGAATQTMYGKLSDIYGRRALLIAAYSLFAIGCVLVGIGRSMGQVILGRVISGCGGSALSVLAMLLITDLVPIRDAAAWQAGLNLAATTGRSLGGPVGGWLADTIGWRWSFLGQVPIFLLAILLCLIYLPKHTENAKTQFDEPKGSSLARIDFLGAALLALTILAFLVPIEIGGTKVPWTHPVIFVLLGTAIVFAGLFAATEEWWAEEPIFPLDLLRHRDIVLGYVVSSAQAAAQLGLMFAVPLYFQVTQRASNTVAGAYLFPAVAGNAVGAIVSGIIIKRTGQYKKLLILATMISASSYLLLFLRWHGHTGVWESLYIFPGGLGTGIVQSAIFIAVQAAVNPSHKAPALGGIWLTVSVGAIIGLAAVSAVTIEVMKWRLDDLLGLMGFDEVARLEIITNAASNVDYLDKADRGVSAAIISAYVEGLSASHLVSLVCSAVAILASFFIREHKL
ncbi:major facilitator superfamily transporter [Plectosphaerella cucumerina]|uniref:Major facilitator superfamily transporter n=1 Tax=Plectosphaerella cucumerina TaxID=40658 RepID=A0A8K0TGL8_9PEZI|nr:major facilitator superfamily transporter [Plectosphaerella cucumerina]